MMTGKGLAMSAVAVAVAAGTYFGLELVFPRATPIDKASAHAANVDEIMSGSLKEDGAAPVGASESSDVRSEDASSTDTASSESEMPGNDNAPGSDTTSDETTSTETSSSDEAQASTESPEATAAEPSDSYGNSDETAASEPTAATPDASRNDEPADTEESANDTATPPPAEDDYATAEPTPAPAPAPKPAAKPKSSAAKHQGPKPVKLTQWWGDASDPNALAISYAGSAAYTQAIVLMFNGAFNDTASASSNITVTTSAGKTVSGQWQIGANNKRMLLFPVSSAGVYTVSVSSGLTDRNGHALGKSLKGPVRVQ